MRRKYGSPRWQRQPQARSASRKAMSSPRRALFSVPLPHNQTPPRQQAAVMRVKKTTSTSAYRLTVTSPAPSRSRATFLPSPSPPTPRQSAFFLRRKDRAQPFLLYGKLFCLCCRGKGTVHRKRRHEQDVSRLGEGQFYTEWIFRRCKVCIYPAGLHRIYTPEEC